MNALKRLAAFLNPEFRAKQAMRLPVWRDTAYSRLRL